MAEFASNAATSAFIELFAFMANYDFESRMSFDPISVEGSIRERIVGKKAFVITEKMKSIWEFIKKKLVNAQESQKRYANKTRIVSSDYAVEDTV
jgi:hypothetical protein